jgi:hypothetical protein
MSFFLIGHVVDDDMQLAISTSTPSDRRGGAGRIPVPRGRRKIHQLPFWASSSTSLKRKSFVRKLMHDLGSASEETIMQEMASYVMDRVKKRKLRKGNFA